MLYQSNENVSSVISHHDHFPISLIDDIKTHEIYSIQKNINNNIMAMIYLSLLCLIVASEAAWVRVWEDNFDWNGGVDLNKWDFDEGGGGWGLYSNIHQCY